MKPTVKHLLIAVVALVLGAVPALALAQSPFRASRDAAQDQYGGGTSTTPGTTSTPAATATVGVTTPVATVGAGVTAQSSTAKAAAKKKKKKKKKTSSNGNGSEGGSNNNNANGNGNGGSGNNNVGADNAGAGTGNGGSGTITPRTSGCAWQPYAWISFGPARQTAFLQAHRVTGNPMYEAQIDEPITDDRLNRATTDTKWQGADTDLAKLKAFAHALGRSVVNGGDLAKFAFPIIAQGIPPFDLSSQQIHPPAGFIYTEDEPTLTGAAGDRRDTFVKAFIAGMRSARIPTTDPNVKIHVPIVGVELKPLKDTTVPFFKQHEVSSVDNVELGRGQTSLQRALDGEHGNFGSKPPSNGLAKRSDLPPPLLCRPTSGFQIHDLIRRSQTTFLGTSGNTGAIVLLALLSTMAVLAVVERRVRKRRSARA